MPDRNARCVPKRIGGVCEGVRGQTHEVRCQWLRPGVHKNGYEKRDRSDLLQSFLSLLLGMFIGVRYVQNLLTKVVLKKDTYVAQPRNDLLGSIPWADPNIKYK